MKRLIIAAALLALPSAGVAQDMRGGVGGSNATSQMRNDAWGTQEMLSQNMRMQSLEQQMDNSRATQNPRVMRRAQEAADLINKGDCAGARQLAQRANDTRLLAGVERACAAAATAAAPASAPAAQ